MIFNQENLKDALSFLYQQKVSKNAAYSMRSFAKKMGISHSTLLQVMSGKKMISSERVFKMGKLLGLTDLETEYLFLLVEREKIQESPLRRKIELRIYALQMGEGQRNLNLDAIIAFAEWESIAVYTAFDGDADLPFSLGIAPSKMTEVIERLIRLGLLVRQTDGSLLRVDSRVSLSSDIPNAALRSYHHKMLSKAQESLIQGDGSKRFVGSETFLLNEETLVEAKKLSDIFLNELSALAKKGQKSNLVYHAGLQIFPIAKEA